jgi:hypothetical protein
MFRLPPSFASGQPAAVTARAPGAIQHSKCRKQHLSSDEDCRAARGSEFAWPELQNISSAKGNRLRRLILTPRLRIRVQSAPGTQPRDLRQAIFNPHQLAGTHTLPSIGTTDESAACQKMRNRAQPLPDQTKNTVLRTPDPARAMPCPEFPVQNSLPGPCSETV